MTCKRVITLASRLSAMLCVIVIVAWIGSYRATHLAAVIFPAHRLQAAASHHGSITLLLSTIRVEHSDEWIMAGREDDGRFRVMRDDLMAETLYSTTHAGFTYAVSKKDFDGLGGRFWMLGVPDWILVLLLILLPTRSLMARLRARRRRRAGHCVVCGYDLRSSGGICPECGSAGAPGRQSIQSS